MSDILYIHPHGHLSDEFVVPAGAITCLNEFKGEKMGIFSCDLTSELVKDAKMVAIDLYWASSLDSVREIVSYIKEVSPRMPIILAGYTASFMPNTLVQHMGVDRVLLREEDESQFIEYVNGHFGDKGALVEKERAKRNRTLDPLTMDWFNSNERISAPSIHLSRCCANPHRMDHSCSMCPACQGSAAEGIYSSDEVAQLLRDCPNKTIFWVTGMNPDSIRRRLVDVLEKTPLNEKQVNVCSCGRLPMEAVDIAEANPNVGWVHIFCYGRPELRSKEIWDEQQAILTTFSRLRSDGYRNFLVLGVLGDVPERERPPAKKKGEQDALMALNWRILPNLEDNDESFAGVEAFSRVVNETLAMRYFSPGIFQHFRLDHDPLVSIPKPLPVQGSEAFLASLLEGLDKWGTLLSEKMAYQCLSVECPDMPIAGQSSVLVAMSEVVSSKRAEAVPAEIRTIPTGWMLQPSRQYGARRFPKKPFVVLPHDLRQALGHKMAGTVRVFCPLENTSDQSITFTIEDCRIGKKSILAD
jgi:hypothetical protein